MSTNETPGNESSGPDPHRLPPAIGVDADGLVHHARAGFTTHVVLAEPGGTVVTTHKLPTEMDRDQWVTHVANKRGWTDAWHGQRLTPVKINERIAAATEAER